MESAVRHTYDAALALQAPGAAAITATAVSAAAVDIYEITKSPYGVLNGRHGIGSFDLVVYVAAADTTTGDETYQLQVMTLNGANQATVQEKIDLTGAQVGKVLVFPLHPKTLEAFAADSAKVQLNAVLAGTTPSLQYWAFLAPAQHA